MTFMYRWRKVASSVVNSKAFIIKYTAFVLLPFAIFIFYSGYDQFARFHDVRKVEITSNWSFDYQEYKEVTGPRGGGTSTWITNKTEHVIGCKFIDEPERYCQIDINQHPNRYGIGMVMTTDVILSRGANEQGWIWSTTMTTLSKVWMAMLVFGVLWVWLRR